MPNNAPTIANLNGDAVSYSAGAAPLRLDAGTNSLVSDPDPFGFVVRRVGTGLSGGPLFVTEVPDGSGRVFVVEKNGTIRILDPDIGAIDPTPFLSVVGQVATSGEQGLLGFALAPDFATSGTFYIYMTNTNGDNEVRRYQTLAGDPDQADPASANRILLIPHPGASNHNAGWIAFGPDGFLYIASGDGAVGANAQSLNTLLGKILRIDPSSDAFGSDPDRDYAIPAGNPFAGAIPGSDEIWAYGLRNPFRASFDPSNGDLWVADVGQNLIEEIDLNPAGMGGLNFGWNVREGTQSFTGPDSPAFTPPVAEYFHGSGPFEGNSVTGGLVYRGPIAGLDGHYVFGDFFDKLWSIPVSALSLGSTLPSSGFTLRGTAFTPDAGTIDQITSFATDQAGNLYITDLGGEVFRVEEPAAPNFAGGRLTVAIASGGVPAEDRLGFAAGGAVTLSNGTNEGSEVRVDGVLVGSIAPGGTGADGEDLVLLFSSGATAARLSTLMRSVTYSNDSADPALGTRTVTIRLNDGAGTGGGGQDTAIVTTSVIVQASGITVTGTPGDDVLAGTPGGDTLQGLGGNDVLGGGPGADILDGGAGNDSADYAGNFGAVRIDLVAGTGLWNFAHGDTLSGVENVRGTEFNDILFGAAGANQLLGNGGGDLLHGGAGGDLLDGGAGVDTADYSGDFGAVSISLATGVARFNFAEGDTLAGIENVTGTEFGDILTGSAAANALNGNGGNDTIMGGAGADNLSGGAGTDTLSYAGNFGGVTVDLPTGAGLFNFADGDVLAGFENVLGTEFADILQGDAANNRFEGNGGNDQLFGRAGNDVLDGGLGADALDGGADVDTADYSGEFGAVFIHLVAGAGHWNAAEGDTLVGIEGVIGTSFGDVFWGNSAANVFTGGGGNDAYVFNAGFSQDLITDFTGNGAAAGDTIRFAAGLFSDFNDMMASTSQQGSDVVIMLDASNRLTLQNTSLADLNSSDFIYG